MFIYSINLLKHFYLVSRRESPFYSDPYVFCLSNSALDNISLVSSSNFDPAQVARATLASFPLGSMSPKSNCSIVYTYPFFIEAVVPPILL